MLSICHHLNIWIPTEDNLAIPINNLCYFVTKCDLAPKHNKIEALHMNYN